MKDENNRALHVDESHAHVCTRLHPSLSVTAGSIEDRNEVCLCTCLPEISIK